MKDRDKALSALTREARAHWKPGPLREGDEERLLERVELAASPGPSPARSAGDGAHGDVVPLRFSSRVATGIATGIAAAVAVAAAALLFTRTDETASNVAPPATHHAAHGDADTSRLASVQGGLVLIDGTLAEPAAVLPEGSEVLARGADAVFKAGDRVRWVLEAGSLVSVDRSGDTGGTIVLALRSGAVEAQVTPVPNGEAFAVDVAGVRVAVHGTHLRVARMEGSGGDARVAVDLNEGMISIGRPPKVGSTYGTTVTAPAHVEFSPSDLDGSIEIDHAPAAVRAPNALLADGAPASPFETAPPKAPETSPAEARSNRSPALAIAPKVLGPIDAVQAAVRSCADQSLKKGAVPTTVQSTLTVEVRADGTASSASFDPPLPPELQQCVAHTVYSAHWSEPGPHRIPIELRL